MTRKQLVFPLHLQEAADLTLMELVEEGDRSLPNLNLSQRHIRIWHGSCRIGARIEELEHWIIGALSRLVEYRRVSQAQSFWLLHTHFTEWHPNFIGMFRCRKPDLRKRVKCNKIEQKQLNPGNTWSCHVLITGSTIDIKTIDNYIWSI